MDEDGDTAAPAAPPPMDSSFMKPAIPSGSAAPSSNNLTNPSVQSFRAPKRKGRGYVDVFGQAGGTKPVTAHQPMLLGSDSQPPSLAAPPVLFNPSLAPIADEDPASSQKEQQPPLVDSTGGEPSMPMMFNPSSMMSVTDPPTF